MTRWEVFWLTKKLHPCQEYLQPIAIKFVPHWPVTKASLMKLFGHCLLTAPEFVSLRMSSPRSSCQASRTGWMTIWREIRPAGRITLLLGQTSGSGDCLRSCLRPSSTATWGQGYLDRISELFLFLFPKQKYYDSLSLSSQSPISRLGGFGVCPFIDSACGREFFICSWRHSVGYWGQSSALYQTGRESQLSPHGQSHSFVFRLSKKQDTSKRFR